MTSACTKASGDRRSGRVRRARAGTRRWARPSTTPEEQPRMTVPEENRRKTGTTDGLVANHHEESEAPAPGGSGRTLREAFEEARVEPDDFAQE
ncbi:conserved hypothetical protein [Streptomyces sviceus ATCC 29083]|uniref:Uncharacterized protein n=2 Tax=Streptomyces TaxID=1883 RepID=B5I709_STRX2|nr:conserved hypothetical protein [Streptomyces sviceus ATCC 29083]